MTNQGLIEFEEICTKLNYYPSIFALSEMGNVQN